MPLILFIACKEDPGFLFPEPDAGPPLRGPGGPAVSFSDEQLFVNCAPLLGDPELDDQHHNEVGTYRGHLVMPWAPEWGGGGLSLFEVNDPCAPVKVGEGYDDFMRETHAIGMVHLPDGGKGKDYAAVTGNLGLQIWDITDPSAPEVASYLILEGIFYPDAYARPVLSLFWQYPWVFIAGADNGIYVVDASDPKNPTFVTQYTFDPVLRAGGLFVMGNLLLVSSAEQTAVAILDVSDPTNPQPIPGGSFEVTDASGEPIEAYHSNVAGDLALFARKEGGGGVIVFDWSNPSAPTYLTESFTADGNGGYVFWDEGYAFLGDSHRAHVFDFRDLANPTLVGTGNLAGDLDTITPYGNVAVLSVDEDAEEDTPSAVMPWSREPDQSAPTLLRVDPPDGATGVPVSARIGVGFDEPVDSASVFAGSIRLTDGDGRGVDGWGSAQENIASYTPKAPLLPGTTYTLEVMAGGIHDINGNRLAETVSTTFTTAGSPP